MTAPDCRSCGACCAPQRCGVQGCGCQPFDHAYVSPEDRRQLPVVYDRHVVDDGAGRAHLATKESRAGMVCVALRGTIGGAVSCRIYEVRPEVCRSFEPGGGECLWARREAGLPLDEPGDVES